MFFVPSNLNLKIKVYRFSYRRSHSMFAMFSVFALFAFAKMMFALGAGMSGYGFSEVCGFCPEETSFSENFFGKFLEEFVILFNDLVKRDRKRSYKNLVLLPIIFSNV